MNRILGTVAVVAMLAVGGCTSTQLQTANSYQSDIASACSVAMALTAVDPAIETYITAGCGTEEAIAALALNPTSLSWVNGLITQAKAPKLTIGGIGSGAMIELAPGGSITGL